MLTDCNLVISDEAYDEQLLRYGKCKSHAESKNSLYLRHCKRVVDIVVSFFALMISLPINLVLAIGTYLTVGRPLLFKQKRVGKDCKVFTIVKFRSMHEKQDENGELLPPDQRVTQFGKFIRVTSLDELLQFWNILKGDMSIIGPRPLPTYYLPRYDEQQILRHMVRPGLECPSINDIYDTTIWEQKFRNDLLYINNISLKTDIFMMYKMMRMLFDKKNNSFRKDGHIGEFKSEMCLIENTAKPAKFMGN